MRVGDGDGIALRRQWVRFRLPTRPQLLVDMQKKLQHTRMTSIAIVGKKSMLKDTATFGNSD